MRPVFALLLLGPALAAAGAGPAHAQGMLVPTSRDVPPLTLAANEVKVTIEDQAAVTHVVQTFRNASSRALEATYIFPVPRGASVKKFTMWVDGKEVPGELVEADKARTIYTDIVNRTKDPGLLEYMGSNLLKVRVFPVPAHGEQKISVCYTSLAASDNGMIEYIFPLKADGNTFRKLEKFTFEATLKAQQPIQNVYSPTHPITVRRPSDKEAVVRFEGKQETLDRDFQLYYGAEAKDVGLTTLVHRPNGGKDGYFMLLISPRAELSKTQQVPRDMVFVLDTSGSMSGKRIAQAKKALKFCLNNLRPEDRFNMIHFATAVTKYQESLAKAEPDEIEKAQRWVDELEATGATNIDEALSTALAMRPGPFYAVEKKSVPVNERRRPKMIQVDTPDGGKKIVFVPDSSPPKMQQVSYSARHDRNFTIVFFTDGQPTIGETNAQKILKNVVDKNTANTRIFTFGVGDDVNAVLLDQLAEKTRSVSTYVRESEDIEAKVSGFYGKISHPVLTNLKLTVKGGKMFSFASSMGMDHFFEWDTDLSWKDIYPQQLPDLFHGSQLVVLGRFSGNGGFFGQAAVTLTGMVGAEQKEFTYDVSFPEKTGSDKAFVEDLWARRKVGYLLDQIRVNGESKEVKDEVISLAKKYGITTPYTSYLVVPDTAPRTAAATWGTFRNGTSPLASGVPGPQNMARERFGSGAPSGSMVPPPSSAPPTYGMAPPLPSSPALPEPAAAANSDQPASGPQAYLGWRGFKSVTETYAILNDKTPSAAASGGVTACAPCAPAPACCTTPAQTGKDGVDLALQLGAMRNQERVGKTAFRQAAGRNCRNIDGVWTDEGVEARMPTVKIKAQSPAYFRMLERHAEMKEVFQLGNRVVWVTPNRSVLVIDTAASAETMSDADIDRLFVVK